MSGIYVDRPYLMSREMTCGHMHSLLGDGATCQMGGRGGRWPPSSRPQGGRGDYYSRQVRRQDTLINKKT